MEHKKAFVMVAHGSRRHESNKEMQHFSHLLAERVGGFAFHTCGFLECAEPSIPQALAAAARSGCSQIIVFPYFLTIGRHVAEDIPQIIKEFCAHNPQLQVLQMPYLGKGNALLHAAVAHLSSEIPQ